MIVNTDNRIIASAMRLMLEPALAPRITGDQRGFLHGRSMLANVIDVEEAMCVDALSPQESLAFFMDFEAAFPSMEHGFLLELFTAAGWPEWLLRYLRVLYHNNVCSIAFGGALFEGGRTVREREGTLAASVPAVRPQERAACPD